MQENLVCVSCEADVAIAMELKKMDIPVMTQNWIVSAVLQYKFDDRLKLLQ